MNWILKNHKICKRNKLQKSIKKNISSCKIGEFMNLYLDSELFADWCST